MLQYYYDGQNAKNVLAFFATAQICGMYSPDLKKIIFGVKALARKGKY